MDFLNPEKQRAHTIRLIIGYALIGVAVLIATLILLYQAYGFGFGKDGEIIQNGLVFMSSQPDKGQIFLDGKLYKNSTNTKLQLPAGQYTAEIKRDGYHDWKRIITVEGGSVQHFDYPKLFPSQLSSTSVKSYVDAPGLATQTPDRRWLIVQQSASPLVFDSYDVTDPKKIAQNQSTVSLPDAVVTNAGSGTHKLSLVEWSTDNRHVMLQHDYQTTTGAAASEYILLDRQTPAESLNLTRALSLSPTKQLSLRDKKYDQYYVYDTTAHSLGTTTVAAAGLVTPLLDQVLAYKSYGSDVVLYITDKSAPAGQVYSEIRDGDNTYRIREHSATGPYLIDLAQYSRDWYVVVGSSADNKVYVYKDPQVIRKASATAVLVPVQILRVNGPTNVSFSSSAQYVMVQNGTSIADYDAEYDKGYRFTSALPIDQPASKVVWMDGQRLSYVSGGKLVVYDYDNINFQTLSAASPSYLPFFDRDYSVVYTLAPTSDGSTALTATSLLTAADQ